MMPAVAFLILAILFNAGASGLFKVSAMRDSTPALLLMALGMIVGGVNAFFYTKALGKIPLSVAYPVFSAGSIVLITLASIALFRETLSLKQLAGLVLLLLGILLISRD